jgi:hypothetical protein
MPPTVLKFKRRARYLEFFTQCVQKALSEGIYDLANEWCEDTTQWLTKSVSLLLQNSRLSLSNFQTQ